MFNFVFKKNKKKTKIDIVKELVVLFLMLIFLIFSSFLWIYSTSRMNRDGVSYYDKLSKVASEIGGTVEVFGEQYKDLVDLNDFGLGISNNDGLKSNLVGATNVFSSFLSTTTSQEIK